MTAFVGAQITVVITCTLAGLLTRPLLKNAWSRISHGLPFLRCKHDEAFRTEALRLAEKSRSTQAAAQQVGIRPKLLYRWQQAQLVAKVGSIEVTRDPEVRQLRAQLKRAEQELDILKSLGQCLL